MDNKIFVHEVVGQACGNTSIALEDDIELIRNISDWLKKHPHFSVRDICKHGADDEGYENTANIYYELKGWYSEAKQQNIYVIWNDVKYLVYGFGIEIPHNPYLRLFNEDTLEFKELHASEINYHV